jgi:flagellar M-ring protein FliF
MNDNLKNLKEKLSALWTSFSAKRKWIIIGSFITSVILLFLLTFSLTNTTFVPIYSDLMPNEAGEIKAAIESKGIPVTVSADGRTISVPKQEAANLKVSLAAEGIPRSGNVDYGIFSENMGLGMTDKHFDLVERDAMQTEIANLIQQVNGIRHAKVMITLPKDSIWLNDVDETATASIVLTLDPGFRLGHSQINGLYHLVSKSVPSLPEEEIIILNQYGQIFEQGEQGESNKALAIHQQQREIRKDIEKDIQRQVQQLLGTILGQDKVVVSVFASIDFTKEKREEEIVRPSDEENNEGFSVSVERIVETYTGGEKPAGATAGTGQDDVPNYEGTETSGNGDYEKIEERINREFDRVYRQIEESPFVIDDLTINIGVEPPEADKPESLTPQHIEDIKTILKNVVRTALSESEQGVDEAKIENKISVFATEFKGKTIYPSVPAAQVFGMPKDIAIGVGIGIVVIVLGLVAFSVFRRKEEEKEDDLSYDLYQAAAAEDYEETPEVEQRIQKEKIKEELELVADNQPQEFVKVLRSWLKEE